MDKLTLSALQKEMMSFLLEDNKSIESHVVKQGNISKQLRLNIYKNAYQARLKEVIDNDHQMLGLYLGDDLFDKMATEYVRDFPSNYTSLRQYADRLPAFLSTQPPFSDHPIISELAHFERLLLVAFDAADAAIITRDKLQDICHDDWPNLVFHFHPSVQLAHFNWNTVESWQALKSEQAPEPATEKKSTWLLWRNNERLTEFRSLSEQELMLINMILSGENFSSLCEHLFTSSPDDDVSSLALQYLLNWLDQGILRDIT